MNFSENSSEETDQQEDDSGGTRRSYECTFCRRGFTNAQALGGHMNIHRKDRAKAKQPNSSSSSNKKLIISSDIINEEPLLSSPYLSVSGQPTRYSNNNYSIFEAQRSYNMYFQPASNPRNLPTPPSSYGFPYDCEYINARSHHHHHQAMDLNQELLGPSLSLQIGPSPVENNEVVRRGIQKDGDVDLELRLGHHPYY